MSGHSPSPPKSPALRASTVGRRASGAYTFELVQNATSGSPPKSPLRSSSSSFSLSQSLNSLPTGVPISSNLDGQSSVKLTASLSRGQTAEASQFCQELLKNPSLIADITTKVIDLTELSDLLHAYFKANGQFNALFRWATDLEVSSKPDTQTLFRGETLATRFFNKCVLSTEGIDFLLGSLNPLVQSVMTHKTNGESHELTVEPMEVESKNGTSEAQSLENLKWYLNIASEFIIELQKSTSKLTGDIKDCLTYLRHSVQVHFGGKMDGTSCVKLVTSIIFLRFICPPLTAPTTFGLLPKYISQDAQAAIAKRLVFLSRLIQSAANNTGFPEGKQHSDTINKFIEENHPLALNFVSDLTSLNNPPVEGQERRKFAGSLSSTGIRSRSSADLIATPRSASSAAYRTSIDPELRKSEEALRNYLQIYYISKRSTSTMAEMQYKTQLEIVLDASKVESKWRTVRNSKKQKLTLLENDTIPPTQKIVGRFKADIATLYDIIKYFANFVKFCPFITHSEVIETYDENASDWYIQTRGSLITSPRDWVFTYRTYSDDKTCVSCYYSIKKDTFPNSSRFVRGNIQGSGFVLERDQNDPEYTNLVAIINWNTGGSNSHKKNSPGPVQGIWKAIKEIYRNTVG
eukprot:TRINITY_DN395_c0_g1_i1.p1 TRINITY_DN395_c0_g1~~TRINITY_DN395_c0_g1_i1.p1  ORF type:complete len:634 (-),score=179.91 TRINITY_DN395_c0_g1_i1:2226-4127(-)